MDVNPAVFVLVYGNFFSLHRRLLEKLQTTLPPEVPIFIWCNQVCAQTRELIDSNGPRFTVHYSDNNVPKYKAMRQMFDLFDSKNTKCNWVLWFDDDTNIIRDDWFKVTIDFISQSNHYVYVGQPWYFHHHPGQKKFIESSKWFKGKSVELIRGRPGVRFVQGGYWWLRLDLLKHINWPDSRLSHNGGDTLLGEAVRQQGHGITSFFYGVRPNDAKRRGMSEKPAGSS